MRFNKYTLQDLVSIKYGKNQKKVECIDGSVPIYGTGGLMGYASEPLYTKPSVLIGRKGSIGKVKYVDHPFWTVDTLFYTEVNEELVLPKYLYYLMSLIDMMQYNEGTTIPSLRTETLNKLEFDIPSLDEQEKVLAVLNPLDEKIEHNGEINKNLLDQALCLYGLKIAPHDNVGCIGDYCSIKSGYAFKSSWWTNEGIRVVKIGSINQDALNLDECSYVSEDKNEKASDYSAVAGDLLIAMTGATIGKFSMVPYTNESLLVNQRVGKFDLGKKPLEMLPFIYCTLKQSEVINEVINRGQGSAQPNISASDIMSIKCKIPNIDIIAEFNSLAKPMFEQIISNQHENQQLSKLRDTLLPQIMSGDLDVSAIDI